MRKPNKPRSNQSFVWKTSLALGLALSMNTYGKTLSWSTRPDHDQRLPRTSLARIQGTCEYSPTISLGQARAPKKEGLFKLDMLHMSLCMCIKTSQKSGSAGVRTTLKRLSYLSEKLPVAGTGCCHHFMATRLPSPPYEKLNIRPQEIFRIRSKFIFIISPLLHISKIEILLCTCVSLYRMHIARMYVSLCSREYFFPRTCN